MAVVSLSGCMNRVLLESEKVGIVYVLKCAGIGKGPADKDFTFYVGWTAQPAKESDWPATVQRRCDQHIAGGTQWTTDHKPLEVVAWYPNSDSWKENNTTVDLMMANPPGQPDYGFERVRGGNWCRAALSKEDRDEVLRLHRGKQRACYKCGSRDHLAVDCGAPTCFACGEVGHLSTKCNNQGKAEARPPAAAAPAAKREKKAPGICFKNACKGKPPHKSFTCASDGGAGGAGGGGGGGGAASPVVCPHGAAMGAVCTCQSCLAKRAPAGQPELVGGAAIDWNDMGAARALAAQSHGVAPRMHPAAFARMPAGRKFYSRKRK